MLVGHLGRMMRWSMKFNMLKRCSNLKLYLSSFLIFDVFFLHLASKIMYKKIILIYTILNLFTVVGCPWILSSFLSITYSIGVYWQSVYHIHFEWEQFNFQQPLLLNRNPGNFVGQNMTILFIQKLTVKIAFTAASSDFQGPKTN